MPQTPPAETTAAATRLTTWRRRALVVLTALLGVSARVALQPLLGDQLPFLIAYPAIAFAASLWGTGAGVFVAMACALAAAIPGVPPAISSVDQPFHIGSFAAAAIFISLVCGARARDRADPVLLRDDAAFDTPLTAWLRAVVWGSVLVPLTAFVAAAWWGYENAYRDAAAAAARAGVLVRGHAEHTFGIAENIAHLADLAASGTDDDIHRREAEVHQRLSDMVAGLPSVVNLNVWDVDGRPLVRSDRFPAGSATSISDRAYFIEQKTSVAHAALGVSEVIRGRQTGIELMNVTIRRNGPGDAFNGVVAVSLTPAFFRDYFRSLAVDNPTLATFALVRTDGRILATWPLLPDARSQVLPGDEIFAQVRAGARTGDLVVPSHRDGEMRFASFQRVGGYPLYVVAAVSRSAMLAGWFRFVGLLAALLVPVTAGLAYVSLVALRKTRREQSMATALNEAMARRAAAEKSVLEGQKLETLAQLTGGVAHDFNNLLAIVNSSLHVHVLLHPQVAEERQVQAMARAVQSGTRLTRQLLSFSRKQALRPETIEFQAWLPGVEGLIRSTLGARIEMAVRVDADVRPVHVDAAELELALINLSLNARHAMPDGGRLTITARNVKAVTGEGDGMSGDAVVVAVADTGIGIPADVLPRVFEPFYTTRTQETGSGLGLSQVHGFCAQAGGAVRIDSTVGEGTRVEMVLPAQAPAIVVAARAEVPEAGRLVGRILLVEDNEDVAISTAAILQSAGLDVSHLWSADSALTALRSGEQRPDLVLSDIEMPGTLSGMDLAFRLRDEYPTLPVILMTGYAKQLEDAVSGGLRVLPKPTPPQELLRQLRALMPQAGTRERAT